MKYSFKSSTYRRLSLKHFSPTAQCDITGFPVNQTDLVPYFEWGGNSIYNTGILAHKKFVDHPNIKGRTPPIYHDPRPVFNARPFAFFEWGRELPIIPAGED